VQGLLVGARGELRGGQVADAVGDQAVGQLDAPYGVADLIDVVVPVPRRAVVAGAVDDDVDMLIGRVTVSDDQRLMTAEAQPAEHLVDSLVPLLGAEMLGSVQAEAEVVDGLLRTEMCAGMSAHDLGDARRVVQADDVATGDPGDALGIGGIRATPGQVGDKTDEVLAEAGAAAARGPTTALEDDHAVGSGALEAAASAASSASRSAWNAARSP